MRATIRTQRLSLRPINLGDVELVYAVFSSPRITRYLLDTPPLSDIGEAYNTIMMYTEPQEEGQSRWVIERTAGGQKMGTVGFHCYDEVTGAIDIGYDLLEAYQGQGYMREAAQAAMVCYPTAADPLLSCAHCR